MILSLALAAAATGQTYYQAAPVVYGDPTGFVAQLNAIRSQYGLPAVSYDPNLASWASQNNAHQAARGIGHHVQAPGASQVAAMAGDVATACRQWLGSAPHRAIILSPSIQFVGFSTAAGWATANAR